MLDDRTQEAIAKFPLRKIRLDECICGHDDSDHLTEVEKSYGYPTGVKNGACAICTCKGFELP